MLVQLYYYYYHYTSCWSSTFTTTTITTTPLPPFSPRAHRCSDTLAPPPPPCWSSGCTEISERCQDRRPPVRYGGGGGLDREGACPWLGPHAVPGHQVLLLSLCREYLDLPNPPIIRPSAWRRRDCRNLHLDHEKVSPSPPAHHRLATGPSLAHHRPITGLPPAHHLPTTGPSLAYHRPITGLPPAHHWPTTGPSLAYHRPTTCLPPAHH